MKPLRKFAAALLDRDLMPTALKVAAVVGTILFTINHGGALVQRKMTGDRWISGLLTYLVQRGGNKAPALLWLKALLQKHFEF